MMTWLPVIMALRYDPGRDSHAQQAGTEGLAVGVQRERRGDPALQGLRADELQTANRRHLVPHNVSGDVGPQMCLDPGGRDMRGDPVVVLVSEREQRQDRRVA